MPRPLVGYVLKRFPRLSETFILREILALERRGVDVVVFALGRADLPGVNSDYARLQARIVYVDDLPAPAGAEPERRDRAARWSWRLAPAVAATGVRHLHAHFATTAADVASHLAAALGLPFSVTMHAKDIFHEDVCLDRLTKLVSRAAFVVTVSDYNVQFLEAVTHDTQTRIHRIYNGVDLSESEKGRSGGRARARVLAVGRMVEKKGFDVFIEAMAHLRQTHPEAEATLIGHGRCEAELRAQAAEHGLAPYLAMPGAQAQQVVAEAMRTHTVLAVPCVVGPDGDRDGLPTVIVEAMSAGLPVVATPVTGIPELVRHEHTGLLVPERDPRALAKALARLIDDPPLAAGLSAAARALVADAFDLQRNSGVLADLFAASPHHIVTTARTAGDATRELAS